MFSRIQQFCIEEFNFSLFNNDRIVITDYEKAVFAALKQYGCRMQGCLFHFAQCVYRKVKSVGLADGRNKQTRTVHFYVRMLMMMAFINPSLKRDAFNDLVMSFDSESVNKGTRDKW